VDLFPDVPVETEVVAVKGAQTADGLIERRGSEFALVLEVNEEIKHARRGQCGEILIREMTAELTNPTVITQAAPFRETFELDEAGEILIPRSRRECVIFFSYA